MPRLYVEEYTKALSGKSVFIACREGILRDYFIEIIADIKFLNRQGMVTTLFHNMPNRFSNQKHFKNLAARLPATHIVKVFPEVDFYNFVLDYEKRVFKIIFLERKYLVDNNGNKINSITTQRVRRDLGGYGDLIGNINFKSILDRICSKIDDGLYDRVHILPAGKNTIKHELFTIEGSGTLIANNYTETFSPVRNLKDSQIVAGILNLYKHEQYLKHRDMAYINKNINNFFATKIDDIVVGCVEKKEIDPQTVELGALAVSTKFQNQRVGLFTVNAFIETMSREGYRRFISLTNNPRLERLYELLGFERRSLRRYEARRKESPGVNMFFKALP